MKLNMILSKSILMSSLTVLSLVVVSTYPVESEAAKKKPRKSQTAKKSQAAKAKKAAPLCAADVATTTMYYVPHIKDFCKGTKPCAAFKKAVKLQGTGTLYNGQVLRYTGKTEKLSSGCTTAEGAWGDCLIPFISVAADPRYYQRGDYIRMPSLKGQKITMPDGTEVEHPGFLIVQDTGGAIKGPNRFDFFTGSLGQYNKTNAFGSHGLDDPTIVDKKSCSASKKFAKVDRNTTDYIDAEEDIARFMDATRGGSARSLASYSAGQSVGGTK
ncbi:MAG TPA: 3D domain-containing protein [Pseudobdellovibrionaceae bacterium]|nr:3D domain-containing protein [Pseudobdellovibrionaceae bacterium]